VIFAVFYGWADNPASVLSGHFIASSSMAAVIAQILKSIKAHQAAVERAEYAGRDKKYHGCFPIPR
jgi:hypothetical protein